MKVDHRKIIQVDSNVGFIGQAAGGVETLSILDALEQLIRHADEKGCDNTSRIATAAVIEIARLQSPKPREWVACKRCYLGMIQCLPSTNNGESRKTCNACN